ncbi:cytochrome c oxidase assembly protein [Acuticoccus sediminis]|uniref:Cytochrome c oxidase assembly protein CtaG n=1 Tax=Acuticoccus sediminis TaxID=2184697 RepID=A0A8B2NSB0_9HYPH|nr:cytochrome c oxidase assembly protein [Acuticoccus sediminis]RAI03098.1 cytochrome c oxidase assembly protein [Acuticoccus sediminis]
MTTDRRHLKVAVACTFFVAVMVGAAFASVPLYNLFCRVTGFDGTPSIATVEVVPGLKVGEREITIRFDANVQSDLPWTFRPVQRTMKVKVGEVVTAEYEISNESDEATVGQSVYNVTPFQGGGYFTKIDCFCFTAQPLGPNETRRIPVVFYVDPEFAEDRDAKGVHVITLSYTFFNAKASS